MIAHHPARELLLDFAAGSLAEGPALAMAAHVALCPECRHLAERLEAVGGTLLNSIAPVELRAGALEACFERIDGAGDLPAAVSGRPVLPHVGAVLPFPLRRYVDGAAKWRVSWGIEEIPIELEGAAHRASLLRIRPGRAMPRHTHSGTEYTLVLAGGYTDDGRHFGPGDLAVAAGEHHAPVADGDGMCVCLTVREAPVTLVGTWGRLLNPILRWRDRSLRRAAR